MATEDVADEYLKFSPIGNQSEECIRSLYIYNNPEAEVEIFTPVGRIDCLSNAELVEIKRKAKWKEGLGQLLAYKAFYKNQKPILLLFGEAKKISEKYIQLVCSSYGVELRTANLSVIQNIPKVKL